MNPLLDQILVALVVLGACGFLLRGFWRSRKSCGDCCSLAKQAPPSPAKKLHE